MLGDTLPAATSALGTAFKSAKAAANSWGQADVVAAISLLEVPFAASKATTNVEQWQMNKAVHYNAWADLEKGDFLPVVTAFRALTAHFSCTTCEEMLSITPERVSKARSEEHTSDLHALMRNSYDVCGLKQKNRSYNPSQNI